MLTILDRPITPPPRTPLIATRRLKCFFCGEGIPSRSQAYRHEEDFDGDPVFECLTCNEAWG